MRPFSKEEIMRKAFAVIVLMSVFAGLCFAQGAGVAKKELVYAQSVPINSLEITGMQPQAYPAAYEAAFAIFNGLVRFTPEMKIVPDLAESWAIDGSGLSWTFKLKQKVVFHDGTLFNADAVISHVNRMIDSKTNVGAMTLWAPVKGAVKIDDYTVRITTSTPYGGLLNVLAHGSGLIPSPTAVAAYGKDVSFHPVGTGPYKMLSFAPGTELVLSANDAYFGPKPVYQKITFKYVADASARVSALRSGEADAIDSVSPELTSTLSRDPNVKLINVAGLRSFGIGLSFTNPLLQNQTIREALNYAIDKDSIVRVIFRNFATVLSSPLAPGIDGAVKAGNFAYSPEKAQSLLKGIGCVLGSDGIFSLNGKRLSFKFRLPSGLFPNDVSVGESIQSQLKKIGVEVTIDKIEAASYWASIRVPKDKVDFDMAMFGYNPSHGDPVLHMEALFSSNKSNAALDLWDFIWYKNTEVDSAIAKAKSSVDLAVRDRYLEQAQQAVWQEAPYIWLYAQNNISACRSNIDTVSVLPVVFTLVQGAK